MTYCDSVILIYFVESKGTFSARATHRLNLVWAAGEQVAFSDLTRLGCRMMPLRTGDHQGLADFDRFFLRSGVTLVPLDRAVYDRVTLIRAKYGYKPVDAIHLAAAVESCCSRFLTNDVGLSGFPDIPVEILP